MRRTQKLLAALVLVATGTSSGCFGSFSITHEVWKRNRQVEGRAGRECVFVALLIVPVYEMSVLADLLLFNMVELFSGENPLADESERDHPRP